jgi:hypothetical protein
MAENTVHATSKDYELLGLNPTASPEEARNAYKALVKRWHPDRFPEQSPEQLWAEEKLKAINGAYQRIRNTRKAAPEDSSVRHPHPPHPSPTGPKDSTTTRKRGKGIRPVTGFGAHVARLFSWIAEPINRLWLARNPRVRRLTLISAVLFLVILWISAFPNPWPRVAPKSPPPAVQKPRGPASASAVAPNAPPGSDAWEPPRLHSLSPRPADPPPDREGPRRLPRSEVRGNSYFTLGSLKQEVLRLQGKPHKIHGQTWVYGLSDISFKEGRVSRYHNFDGTLKIRVLPTANPPGGHRPTFFTLGATQDEVLWVQGTPTRIDSNKWYYGFSEITFKDARVNGFNNFFNSLQIRMQPGEEVSKASAGGHFTIGSSEDVVLAVQGTPDSIQAGIWSYQFSEVWFQEGKVRMVNNFSGNLKYAPPDLATDK